MLIDGGDEASGDTVYNVLEKKGIRHLDVLVISHMHADHIGSASENDSLVLMITYGETRFLFTGDIEDDVQTRISDKYDNEKDEAYNIDLIKMPHHGSISSRFVNGTDSLYSFIRTFMPDYAVISVGQGNMYGHPHRETLDLLDDADVKVYRTDMNGDIIVHSDGKNVSVECSK